MSAELSQAELAKATARKIRKAGQIPPKEMFARLVKLGFVNKRGQVTKKIGGSAKPEPKRAR